MRAAVPAAVLLAAALGCATGSYDGPSRGWGHDPYDDRGGLSRREQRELTDEQALERRRLERLQRERREDLRARQEERRDALESAGEWDDKDARRQQRARQTQRERQQERRGELRDQHGREWDRYGY